MTTPLAADRPDWLPTVPGTVVEVFSFSGNQNVGLVNYGRKYVGTHPYLWLKFQGSAGGIRVILTWYPTSTSSVQLGIHEAHWRQLFPSEGSFPALGPWVQIEIEANPVPQALSCRLWSSLLPSQSRAQGPENALIQANTVPVGAGAVLTIDSLYCRWGWGHWTGLLLAGVGHNIQVGCLDFAGGFSLLDIHVPPGDGNRSLFLVPPRPIRVTVFNADAVAHFFYCSVTIHTTAAI